MTLIGIKPVDFLYILRGVPSSHILDGVIINPSKAKDLVVDRHNCLFAPVKLFFCFFADGK